MDWECVHIPPEADSLETTRIYTEASWASLRRRRPMASEVRKRRSAAFNFEGHVRNQRADR